MCCSLCLVSDLGKFVTTSCNGKHDGETVEVSIMQRDLARLNLTSINQLRLLDNRTACKPARCCNESGWKWQFSEKSLCGGQLKFQKEYDILTLANVVRYRRLYLFLCVSALSMSLPLSRLRSDYKSNIKWYTCTEQQLQDLKYNKL